MAEVGIVLEFVLCLIVLRYMLLLVRGERQLSLLRLRRTQLLAVGEKPEGIQTVEVEAEAVRILGLVRVCIRVSLLLEEAEDPMGRKILVGQVVVLLGSQELVTREQVEQVLAEGGLGTRGRLVVSGWVGILLVVSSVVVAEEDGIGGGGGNGGGSGGSGYVFTSSTYAQYPAGCLLNSSHFLSDAQTIAGNQYFPAPGGGTEFGHGGDGYARITLVE